MQIAALALAAAAFCAIAAIAGSLAFDDRQSREVRAAMLNRELRIDEAEKRVKAYRAELAEAAAQLEKRQTFIEEIVSLLPAGMVEDEAAAEAGDADKAAGKAAGTETAMAETPAAKAARLALIGKALPEAAGLARVEHSQLAAVSMLTRYAEDRVARAETAIRKLGLDPRGILIGASASAAMGGPLEKFSTEPDGSLDPRFERLGTALTRMAALENGLARVPQVMPTGVARMTSNFGYRRDPFTGASAMHSGLDFGGRTGDPIHAAAAGTVSFVGYRSGYGKIVEIAHGNGLTTRYAHMSAWKTKRGATVEAGDVIGALGSTGRSTGPHLHFEVRIGDRAVNPRPFLENAPALIKEMRQ